YQHDAGNVPSMIDMLSNHYDYVVLGLHRYSRRPANNFGIGIGAMRLIQALSSLPQSILLAFGNPYVLGNFCEAKNVVACYEDNAIIQSVVLEILTGKLNPTGKLPVTVCNNLPAGTGLSYANAEDKLLPRASSVEYNFSVIDSIVQDAIVKKAMPGAVVLATKDGKIIFEKAYGYTTYDSTRNVKTDDVFDLASVTKVLATTLSVMKLYEAGKIDLDQRLGNYLPELRGTMHDALIIRDLLLHQSGLPAWIPFYKQMIDTVTGLPFSKEASCIKNATHSIRVANHLYLQPSWKDSIYKKILDAGINQKGKYVYSDLGFIYLGRLVERLSGETLDQYVRKQFYEPMSLHNTGYLPQEMVAFNRIVPTENEKKFRMQLLWGDVHDPAAAMLGGVAGHAGLFGTAYESAALMQMLMNGGSIGGKQYLQAQTVTLFTGYGSDSSRRGLGFDKPDRDNKNRKEPYPCKSVSTEAFGHTGFTGTCVWADPKNKIVFVLLSNRVHPSSENTLFGKMNIRGKVQEVVYASCLSEIYRLKQAR
ncbi:MAG: serine hydrolase domain-containing protein, partial [Bacteroidota bacterium]